MVKFTYALTTTLLCVVLPIVCDGVNDQPVTKQVLEKAIADKTQPTSQGYSPTETSPIALSETSSAVFDDGSFEFNIQNAKVSIRIRGEVKRIQGEQTLVIDGSYNNTDTGYLVEFSGSDKKGFFVLPYPVPVGIPPKVIATIVG